MKKLRLFDSLKFVVAVVVATLILNVAHADDTNCASYIDYTSATGTVSQNGTPTPTNPITPQFYTQNEMVLRAVGDYADSYDTATGKITRRVGVKVLDGTEGWASYQSGACWAASSLLKDKVSGNYISYSTHYGWTSSDISNMQNNQFLLHGTQRLCIKDDRFETATGFRRFLADQYAAGNPVIVVYPLETPVTEDWPSRQCETIKIATTRYNERQFAPVETRLDAAVAAVDTVVTQTMSQAQQIDQIATNKQTRPDETCPPFKKCLLVEDEDGTPHWYEIYDPINDFLRPILAAAEMSGNRGAPTKTTHTSGSNTIFDTYNGFYKTNNIFKNQYVSGTVSAQNRPFGPTTLPRCDDNATRTAMPTNAGICYNTGGMFRDLTDGPADDAGEWAVVYNGNEGGASLGITPGVVYGVAKCTTVGQHTTQMTGDVADGSNYWWPKKLTEYSNTTLSSLIEQYPNVVDVFNTLPNPVGTDEKPGYPRANYRNCWCKMTAIGVPGAGDDFTAQAANGSIMSVSGDWVFDRVIGDLNNCVGQCAYYCTSLVMVLSKSRKAVFTAN